MNSNRCEVCDDTNATIHCQECRRRTCEECDEILHLVDANKSHHRIPLFPSRGGSAVNSRGGSLAATRNVSPRGMRRQEELPTPMGGSSSIWPENNLSKPIENNNYTTLDNNYGNSSLGDYSQPSMQQPVQQAQQRQAPPLPQNEYTQPQQVQQPQRSQPPPPPEPTQYQPSNTYGQPAYQQPQQQQPQHQQQPPPQQQYRQPNPYGQARSGYATPSGGGVMGGQRSGYATPTTAYQYPVPRSMAHSGAATPTYAQQGQRYVSGTVPYSQWGQQNQPAPQPRVSAYDQKPMLDAQPTNPQQQAYLQHVELIQQHKAVEAHQRLMAQRNDQMARQSQQHYPRPVSGHVGMQPVQPQPQRYTTSYIMSNHGSVVSSVAPSARNSPPMQPMQPRIAVPAFQQLEPARQYVPVGSQYARASVGHGYPSQSQYIVSHNGYRMNDVRESHMNDARQSHVGQPMQSHLGQPMLQPVYSGYATPSMYAVSSSLTRTPYNEPRTPPMYTQAMNIGSVPRTPYNEPRTPFNEPQVIKTHYEPRSPANEPSWMDRRPVQQQQPQIQRAAPPQAVRNAPPPPDYSWPAQQPQQQQQQASQPSYTPAAQPQQQYGAPVHSYALHQLTSQGMSPQRSAPMPPANTYSQYTPPGDDSALNGGAQKITATSWSNRYDPDEAEARVRNLIADTERMLAGLSGLAGSNAHKPSEGVSV